MHYSQNREETVVVLALLAALVLASCSGSGTGGSTVSGISLSSLVVADHVSVVEPKPSGSSKPKPAPKGFAGLLLGLISSGQLPATSDYFADKTSVYVNERSTESFSTINQILCMVRQTRYDAMTNKGPYLALVDENLCSTNRSDASTAGQQTTNQSSGSSAPSYMSWVTDSYRGNDTSPQIVRYWITTTGEVDILILARLTITESADIAPPYGLFKMDFQMVNPATHVEFSRGVLVAEKDPTTGEAVLKFASNDPDLNQIEASKLAKDPNGTIGHGTVLKISSGGTSAVERFDVAYNTDYFRRHDAANGTDYSGDICLDRQNFEESAWSYGLYNEDGSRYNLNSGFSIKVGSDYGWIGYWGVSLPTGVTLTNGQTVYQHDFQTDTDTPYTVFQAGGKLKKHLKNTLTLADIKNVPLYWWDFATNAYYTVIWTGSALTKTAKQDPSGYWQICTAGDLLCGAGAGPWNIDLKALNSSDFYFYSQALSGQVRVPLPKAETDPLAPPICTYNFGTSFTDCSLFDGLSQAKKDNTPVIFYTENIVYPGDAVPATLACFDNCPDATLVTGIDPTAVALPFHSTWDPVTGTSTKWEYTFSPSTMLLMDPDLPNPPDPVVLSSTSADPSYQYGVTTGALFDPTSANMAMLDCNWDGDNNPSTPIGPAQICGWKAWSELPVFYTWETGPNAWNQLTVLKNSAGAFVKFDPPLQVQYVHHAPLSNPTPADTKYDGVTFYLEYNGFGSLSGIPGVCIDPDTGATASCGQNTWWVPEFLIPDLQPNGVDLTEMLINDGTGRQLIVKPLQIEQRMKHADLTVCDGDGLTPPTGTLDPDMFSAYDDPNNGTMPRITTGPKVIGGVVQ